jgi:hypothetical protein
MNWTPHPGSLTIRHSFAPMVSGSFSLGVVVEVRYNFRSKIYFPAGPERNKV